MANKITAKKWSESKKRVDFTLKVSPFLEDSYELKVRLLSRVEMTEADLKSAATQIIDRKKEWKENKSSYSLFMNHINANAYIFK